MKKRVEPMQPVALSPLEYQNQISALEKELNEKYAECDHLRAEIKRLNAELLRLASPLPEAEQMKALADRLPGM